MSKSKDAKFASEEEARQVAEAARESQWDNPSFLKELFLGKLRLDIVEPFPDPVGIDRPEFQEYYAKFKKFLEEEVDGDAIDREGKIPDSVRKRLAEFGAFGLKIKKEYGGKGFSQAEYNKLMQLLGSHDGNVTAL